MGVGILNRRTSLSHHPRLIRSVSSNETSRGLLSENRLALINVTNLNTTCLLIPDQLRH